MLDPYNNSFYYCSSLIILLFPSNLIVENNFKS
jgi:hypothetical protein